MPDKLGGLISLAAKAGKMASGEMSVVHAVQSGKVKLLFADAQASANTKDKMGKLSLAYSLPLIFVEGIGERIGKPGRTMVALCDAGFAQAMGQYVNLSNTGVQKLNDED